MISHQSRQPLLSRRELALLGITVIWGATFLIIQQGLAVSGPLFYVGTRFAVAALLMLVASFPLLKGFTRQDLLAGLLIGLCTFGGNALQTAGLQTITSSKSAFITALYVPMVPLLQWVVLKRLPPFMRWVGILLAFTGLVLLAGPEGQAVGFGAGELLTLLSAVVISAQIILIGKYAGAVDVRRVTVTQLSTAAVLAFASMPLLGEAVPGFSWQFVLSAGGLGVASIVIALVMNWAQQEVSPTRATLIYSAEPVWAGIFGRIAGERLPALGLLGAALIVTGVLVSELRPKWSFRAIALKIGAIRSGAEFGGLLSAQPADETSVNQSKSGSRL